MQKALCVFKVDDAVFYPSAGVGIIEKTEDLYINGESQRFLVIRIQENNMVIKVPQGNVKKCGIRPLLGNRQLKELFRVLSAKTVRRIEGNWTERYKLLERKIQSGSYKELGEVVRDLMRSKSDGRLSFEEARLLEMASNYLTREIAAVEKIPPEAALARIRSHIDVDELHAPA